MKKKILLWGGGVLLALFVLLLTAPFLFKSKIQEMVLKTINENLTANVTFDKVNLSLLKGFPKATITIDNLSVVNTVPFEGDTLFRSNQLRLKMSVLELFNGTDKPMKIEDILVSDAKANIIINEQGIANYDIAIKKEEEEEEDSDSEDKPFALNLNHYKLENVSLTYNDLKSKMSFAIEQLNHQGTGNLSTNVLDLNTESMANVSFSMDNTKFLNKVSLSLKAVIGMDMDKQIYTFKDNELLINQLPLKFNGSIQLQEAEQVYDVTFSTPTSDFKNFLGLVPEAYAGDLKGVTTTGEFAVSGKVKGKLTDTTIPTIDIKMASANASFKYPDLPKTVKDIVLDVNVTNDTGLPNDTAININKLSFKIDQDVFNASINIKNIVENALIAAQLNGVINLANATKAYPVKLDMSLSGILRADVNTSFDMQTIEKEQYQNIRNSGSLSLTNFNFENEAMAKPLQIQEAALTFNPNHVSLNTLKIKTGSTDIAADGKLDNLYGFLFNKQTLKGNFFLKSDNFVVADLLKESKTPNQKNDTAKNSTPSATEPLKIPDFLDCTITANANTVVYDNLKLKNVKGRLIVRDEAAKLEDMSTDVFGGSIAFGGNVSTKNAVPSFDMNLGLKNVDIKQTFTDLSFLKAVAPIADVVSGRANAVIGMNGMLKASDLAPDLNSLTGDIKGDLSNAVINAQNAKLLSSLDGALDFVDLKKIDLSNKKMHIVFDKGRVQFKPFDIKSKDVAVTVSGEHGFDQTLNYVLDFKVPAKVLGKDVANILATLGPKASSKFEEIPVKVGLTGNFKQPKVAVNMAEVIKNITNQIVEEQSNQLIDKGAGALLDILGGKKNKGEGSETADGANGQKDKTEETVNKISEGLKGIFGKKKKEE
ncbi:MAG: AsmA family protein [Flavobacteriaceae bacterium]|nr:AsmA family protein [Flavobacteriaceae bacterium]